jgi:hypothetical protein
VIAVSLRDSSLTTVSKTCAHQPNLNRQHLSSSVLCSGLSSSGEVLVAQNADARNFSCTGSSFFDAHALIAECVRGRRRYCKCVGLTRRLVRSNNGAAREVRNRRFH